MEDAAKQLHEELRASVQRALLSERPIITHLNADTTWMLQLPCPRVQTLPNGRSHFNILIDPWLSGPQADVASWFSVQWHSILSSVQSIAELEERLQDIEEIARWNPPTATRRPSDPINNDAAPSLIDLVVISHEFTDHCHRTTLLEVDSRVPVFATEKAVDLIRSWNHFQTIVTIPTFSADGGNWRETSLDPLPQWLGISRVVTAGNSLYYHSALLMAFEKASSSDEENSWHDGAAECLIYSPHGIEAEDLQNLPRARPSIQTIALLHGLHDVALARSFQLNLGAHNGLKAQRICKAKYWIGTHDEVKKGGGLISPFLRRSALTLQEAVERELAENGGHILPSSELAGMKDINFCELSSGESLLLL